MLLDGSGEGEGLGMAPGATEIMPEIQPGRVARDGGERALKVCEQGTSGPGCHLVLHDDVGLESLLILRREVP